MAALSRSAAGARRVHVAFDPPRLVDDGHGNEDTSWNTDDAVSSFVEVRYMRGSESDVSGRLSGQHRYKFKVLATAATRAITTDWRARVLRTGETLDIEEVDGLSDRRHLWVVAVSQTGIVQ